MSQGLQELLEDLLSKAMTPETSLHCVDVEAVGKASQPEERRSSCFAVAAVHGVKVSVTHLLLKGAVD